MHTSPISKPVIIISMGDPSGIGPEVILKAMAWACANAYKAEYISEILSCCEEIFRIPTSRWIKEDALYARCIDI